MGGATPQPPAASVVLASCISIEAKRFTLAVESRFLPGAVNEIASISPFPNVVITELPVSATDQVAEVYRKDGARLWRALFAYCGDRDVADDAAAEAFAQALHRGAAVRDPAAWVWRAGFRIAAGELKRRRRRLGTAVEQSYEIADTPRELMEALAKLSKKQRGSIVLHHYAGYPVREVAAILDSTSQAVRVHLFRGRKRLRQLLEVDDD